MKIGIASSLAATLFAFPSHAEEPSASSVASTAMHPNAVHGDVYSELPALGLSLTGGWLEPWPHSHYSRGGAPFIHGFGLEPAYLDRDLFLDFAFVREKEGNALETEVELEWALTRRWGFVVELPYLQSNPDDGRRVSGFGDLAIAPRALIYEGSQLLVSANVEISFPTGDKPFGGEEMGLAPSISTWLGLGQRTTLLTQIGWETGLESGDSEIFYSAALTHSLLKHPNHDDAAHFPTGMVNLITEFTGRSGIHGDEDGESSAELLFGLSYLISPTWEIRTAYQFPVTGDSDLRDAFLFGVIHHF